MENTNEKIVSIDWDRISGEMHGRGYDLIEGFLSDEQCEQFKNNYDDSLAYRKTVVMERYRFGFGEYKYFTYPLPDLIQTIRQSLYPVLAPIANTWMKALKIETTFPAAFSELQALCHSNGQTKPTVLILKYGKGGYNTMHQDLYGDVYFPMQTVLFLNEPGKDYSGGEFVLMQQIPRAQSRAIVLTPKKGDMLIFATNFRPVMGSKGYYRVSMKHGVSEVLSGERYTLGIVFHDALS